MKQNREIKVLLVDDDQLVLDDLIRSINWKKEGFHIVGTATNGKRALSLFKAFHPQIVITDVIMPIMNGIELIKAIKSISDKTEFLILSSYDEFDYAKSAMSLGVTDYLLKMELTPVLMTNILLEISSKLENEQKTFSLHQQLLLQEYMKHRDIASTIFDSILHKKYNFYFIGWSDTYKYQVFNQHPLKTASQQTIENISKVLHLGDRDLIFANDHYVLIGYVPSKLSNSSSLHLKALRDSLPLLANSAKVFYTNNACSIKHFRTIYEETLNVCNFELLFSEDSCISLDEIYSNMEHKHTQPISIESTTIAQLYSKSSTEEAIKEFLDKLYSCKQTEPFISLYHYTNTLTGQKEFTLNMFTGFDSFCSFIIDAFHTLLTQQYDSIPAYSAHVNKAIAFIESNFANSTLSTESIADNLGISCGRLSVLFKKETGKTLVEYITDYRIQHATWLLLNSNKKIYEIASAVGYNSSQYFSQIFLHKTGKKPLDYRQSSITTITIGE
ncbi:MAG TPA: response regulator [Clostridiales bacterium]|nr:response regulator [Clostridiales bacterium]